MTNTLNDRQCIDELHIDHTNMFVYTTITGRKQSLNGLISLRIKGPTFLLPAIAVQSKGQIFKKNYKPSYRDQGPTSIADAEVIKI